MSPDQDLDRRRLAFRRAGYAVARYTQGYPVPALTLSGSPQQPVEGDEGGGARRFPVDMGSRTRHRLELQALAMWAALLSESHACLDDREPAGGWGPVRAPMVALTGRVTRGEAENEAYLEWLRQRALGLLALPEIWSTIESLADRLLAEGAVGAKQANALIGAALQGPTPRSGISGWLRRLR